MLRLKPFFGSWLFPDRERPYPIFRWRPPPPAPARMRSASMTPKWACTASSRRSTEFAVASCVKFNAYRIVTGAIENLVEGGVRTNEKLNISASRRHAFPRRFEIGNLAQGRTRGRKFDDQRFDGAPRLQDRIEKLRSIVSGACHASTCGSMMLQLFRSQTTVPTRGRLNTRPLAASIFRASRMTVRLTPYSRQDRTRAAASHRTDSGWRAHRMRLLARRPQVDVHPMGNFDLPVTVRTTLGIVLALMLLAMAPLGAGFGRLAFHHRLPRVHVACGDMEPARRYGGLISVGQQAYVGIGGSCSSSPLRFLACRCPSRLQEWWFRPPPRWYFAAASSPQGTAFRHRHTGVMAELCMLAVARRRSGDRQPTAMQQQDDETDLIL
jgi:hypothetical protein